MTNGDWPAPEPHEDRRRLPLPRVDDLPVAEQGYDREAVREAFDAFYRHAAQLDATLRTLEAVEVFQRTATELRAEMRTIRAAGWTVSSYGRGGYGSGRGGGVREWSLPPAFPRVAAEALFLIVIGIIVGVAGWSRIAIVLVMALALAIVWLVEFVASRERAIPRATAAPAPPPKLDEEPAELPASAAPAAADAGEAAEAMTVLGKAGRTEEAVAEVTEEEIAEPEPEPEPKPEPEPEPITESEAAREPEEEPEREPEPPPEIQLPPSPIVLPGGAPPIPAPVPPEREQPEPAAAEADLAEVATDTADEPDEAPEARAEEFVAQSHYVEPALETPQPESDEDVEGAAEAAEKEFVAQSHKVQPLADEVADEIEAAPEVDEDTLSGVEPLAVEPERRRFRLFRRSRRAEAEPSEPEPAPVEDAWVVPTSERPPDADVPEGAAGVVEPVDPWERGPELEPEPVALDVEPEPEPEASTTKGEPEPVELVVEPEPESAREDEPEEASVADLPVEAVADQAGAALDRSRARRRPPRRARRR